MPKIYKDILLPCPGGKAFSEMTDVDFVRKIQPESGVEFETTFKSERLTRCTLRVGKWGLESEKVIIPETFTFVTRRTVSSPAGYSLTIQMFEDHEKTTMLKHIEDFEPDEGDERLLDLKRRASSYLQGAQRYFTG